MENRNAADNRKSNFRFIVTAVLCAVSIACFIACVVVASVAIAKLDGGKTPVGTDKDCAFETLYETYKYNAVELRVGDTYGTGFVYGVDGGEMYLFTNYHVSGGDVGRVQARFYGTNEYAHYETTLVGRHEKYDVALLKIQKFPKNPYVDLRKDGLVAEKATVGKEILCLGNNLGRGIQAQNGIISADSYVTDPLGGSLSGTDVIAVISVCAPLNSGNSGAAVYDSDGKLVGMNSWRAVKNAAGEAVDGTCYLTPATVMAAMYENFVGNAATEWGGFPYVTMNTGNYGALYIHDIGAELAFKNFELTVTVKTYDLTVPLEDGDVITEFGAVEVKPCNFPSLIGELFKYSVRGKGKPLRISVKRGGRDYVFEIGKLKRLAA